MDDLLYQMIFKRKSFHIFQGGGTVSAPELLDIERRFQTLEPLVREIRTDIKIVPAQETTCRRGEGFCILLYSERKGQYLQNIGYLGEQLDLYLASRDIGVLWFGIGKPEHSQHNGLDFVIMLAIAKMPPGRFRRDMYRSKRKPVEEIWSGEPLALSNVVRFAPSACNSQPWFVENEGNALRVYRYKKPGRRGIMPAEKVGYYNRIDMGIFLLFLELCLKHDNRTFTRTLYPDAAEDSVEKALTAEYLLT